jgi:DNA polymerase I
MGDAMPYKIDFLEDSVVEWTVTPDGVEATHVDEYTPTLYVAGDSHEALAEIRPMVGQFTEVVTTGFEEWRTVWRDDPEPVLRVDVADIDAVTDVAYDVRGWGQPSEYRLFNVDFTREFRYCLENDLDPTPRGDLSDCRLSAPREVLSNGEITPLTINDRDIEGARDALDELVEVLDSDDPDVLVVNSSQLIPLLFETADALDVAEFELGRLPGYQQLASESTFESYGRVGHSPARYNVPGRAIIDTSNSFFWSQTSIAGILDLVSKSRKPLQETSWASIGNVFTGIQIREAMRSGVLVPWNSWRHEYFKPMSTLHEADRGGFTFSPDVGFHEDVHELDFSSLYPNIMITRNVSPDRIRCACHADREDVPGLGYSICDEEGFLVRVLEPLVSDREDYKAELRENPSSERAAELKSRSNALKWILVSCFGYQGFSNAKFGRIECHEAINAYAREILLDTKELLEVHGWNVIHGIVDSVWVSANPAMDQTPLDELADHISREIEIPLDYEAHYDWIAFAPRKDSAEGALNRYFAKVHGEDEFKKRGIEVRQRSTPPYIEMCQQELLEVLDEHREPAPVCDRLEVQLGELRRGDVDPSALVIRRRVSKQIDEYTQYTRNVAALERADDRGFAIAPGEDVEFVVVDDSKSSRERVALAFEHPDTYDIDYYVELLIRAAESIVSPLGWDRSRIRRYLADTEDSRITAY